MEWVEAENQALQRVHKLQIAVRSQQTLHGLDGHPLLCAPWTGKTKPSPVSPFDGEWGDVVPGRGQHCAGWDKQCGRRRSQSAQTRIYVHICWTEQMAWSHLESWQRRWDSDNRLNRGNIGTVHWQTAWSQVSELHGRTNSLLSFLKGFVFFHFCNDSFVGDGLVWNGPLSSSRTQEMFLVTSKLQLVLDSCSHH